MVWIVGFTFTALIVAMMLKWRSQVRAQADEITALSSRNEDLSARLSPILDIEAEASRIQAETNELAGELSQLRALYAEKREIYGRLTAELAIVDERLAFAEMGVYEPHFEFTDPETFRQSIVNVRGAQKAMIDARTAVFCTTQWEVGGSVSKGKVMTNRNIRLTLRAFNNECDAAIANARWNNVNAMEKRILRAREQIDKLNASNMVFIADGFLHLKLTELHLTHELREAEKRERDERAETLRLAREEQRLLRDLEKAEVDEQRQADLLAKAREEVSAIDGPRLDAYQKQIMMLEQELAAARQKRERAQAMAEQTRSGYVYIISNIGSFGEGIVKIGLTRRLDPMDRVRELGDASVPFIFDTHAIIYSDDAPMLERALHTEFATTRINAQNFRKEFFRASIDDVEAAVARLAPGAAFFRDVEAQEYMETLSRRKAALATPNDAAVHPFPAEI